MNDSKKKYESKEFNKVLKIDGKEYQVYIAEIKDLEKDGEKTVDALVMEKSDKSKEDVKKSTDKREVKIKFNKGTFSPHYDFSKVGDKDVEAQKVQVKGIGTYYWYFWLIIALIVIAVIGVVWWIIWALNKEDKSEE